MSPVADRSVRPAPGPAPELKLPAFHTARLDGGLDLWLAERRAVPEVSLRLVLEAGAVVDPRNQEGVAELTARLLTEGAGERDAVAVAQWLDHLGASFRVSVQYDVAIISMHFLSDVTEGALDFLAAVVREPRFDDSEVVRIRDERLDEIARERDEPAIVADQALIRAIYGEERYGVPAAGTADSVARLARADVRRFHHRRYGPRDALLIACGDLVPSEFEESVRRRFGDWGAAGGRPDRHPARDEPVEGAGVLLIDRPESPQAELRVGTVGAPHGSEDLFPIMVANAILGGLFNSRINMNLREDKGWTYGARTAFRLRRGDGPFVARTAVDTAVTAAAFEEILNEIDGLSEVPPTEEEMQLARHALTLSLPLQFETSGQVCQRVGRRLIYRLPEDYWETYRARVESVTAEEVSEVCRKYLSRDRLLLVTVTDAESARGELARLGPLLEARA
jgi:zinc protease